jgi:transcription initiation factor TFIID TATA-box-binding protein
MRKRKYSSLPSCNSHVQLHMGAPLPTVHNIVATSQIVSSLPTLDLNRVHAMLPFSFYDQNKFAAITVRLHEPDCTTLLFSSGKLVVTGCRTWYECVYASLFIADLLRECLPGHAFTLATCDVQNMVAHVEIPVGEHGCLDLHGMYEHMALNCTYQRKMFPGLIFRPESSPVVLLCFFSGKVVITGGKTMEDVYSGWNRLWPVLKSFVVAQTSERSLPPSSLGSHRRAKSHARASQPTPQPSVDGGEHEKGLALVRHAVAGDPGGLVDPGIDPAGGGYGRVQPLDLGQPGKLEGLQDDLAAKG